MQDLLTDLNVAQREQARWSERNFPDRSPDHAIMGMIEELGEICDSLDPASMPDEYRRVADSMRWLGQLAHINLKRKQGIRKQTTSFDRECDALDQLARSVTDYGQAIGYPPNHDVDPVPFAPDEAKERDGLADIVVFAIDRCNRKGISFAEIFAATLSDVLKRDWSKKGTGAA